MDIGSIRTYNTISNLIDKTASTCYVLYENKKVGKYFNKLFTKKEMVYSILDNIEILLKSENLVIFNKDILSLISGINCNLKNLYTRKQNLLEMENLNLKSLGIEIHAI